MDRFSRTFYPETQFGGFTDIDGTLAFYLRVNALLRSDSVVLDFGCGRGAFLDDLVEMRRSLRTLRGRCDKIIGLDIDEAAAVNPAVDDFRLLTGDRWPVEDDSVDLCVCDSVIEHLPKPDLFFAECRRVLRDGGLLCIRTSNRWSYVSLAARIIPGKMHGKVIEKVQAGRKAEDVFPTHYLCNTVPQLKRHLARNGFEGIVYGYEAEPSYLSFSRPAYFLGVLHQRFAPKIIRPALFAFARLGRPAS